MTEIWKELDGTTNKYLISNLGNIISINYRNTGVRKSLKQWYTNSSRCNRGKGKHTLYYRCKIDSTEKLVHRLVASAFIENPYNKPYVNHIDGNSLNNEVTNLEWCTSSENSIHAYTTGLRKAPVGELSGMSKFSNNEIIELKKIINSGLYYQHQIAKVYGVSQCTISSIKLGKTWKV